MGWKLDQGDSAPASLPGGWSELSLPGLPPGSLAGAAQEAGLPGQASRKPKKPKKPNRGWLASQPLAGSRRSFPNKSGSRKAEKNRQIRKEISIMCCKLQHIIDIFSDFSAFAPLGKAEKSEKISIMYCNLQHIIDICFFFGFFGFFGFSGARFVGKAPLGASQRLAGQPTSGWLAGQPGSGWLPEELPSKPGSTQTETPPRRKSNNFGPSKYIVLLPLQGGGVRGLEWNIWTWHRF